MRQNLILCSILLAAGCSGRDPVAVQGSSTDPESWFEGNWSGDEFVLQEVEVPVPDALPLHVALIASDLVYDPTRGALDLNVSVRNLSSTPLYAPAHVGLSDFIPAEVFPVNEDFRTEDPRRWWYSYSSSLGEDGILAGGETSGPVRWSFRVRAGTAFSFSAVARFAPEPSRPVLGGRVFSDLDRDGVSDPDEPGGFGQVEVRSPDGTMTMVQLGDMGRWGIPVRDPGLYEVHWIAPPTAGFVPICLTTPNPVQVILPEGDDGLPPSFRQVDFGIDPEPCIKLPPDLPLGFTPEPVDSLPTDPWFLDSVSWIGPSGQVPDRDLLLFGIGFSGCDENHPLRLVIEEPVDPGRVRGTVVHDDLGQLCDAWFVVTRRADLAPLRERLQAFPGYDGKTDLALWSSSGVVVIPLY